MRVVLIEDEAPALAELERAARACDPQLEVLARLGSVESALAWFTREPAADLILADIMLADGPSLTIFERIEVAAPIVFCTAYDHHWTEALARGGIDYLVKPIEVERLRQTFAKLEQLRRHFTSDFASLLRTLGTPASRHKTRIVVKRGHEFISLAVADIAYFTTEHKLSVLVDRGGARYLLDPALSELAADLDPLAFFRANRQYLIAFTAIESWRPAAKGRLALSLAQLAGPVVVSQENAKAFREWFER